MAGEFLDENVRHTDRPMLSIEDNQGNLAQNRGPFLPALFQHVSILFEAHSR